MRDPPNDHYSSANFSSESGNPLNQRHRQSSWHSPLTAFDWHRRCIPSGVMQNNLSPTDLNAFRSILISERRKLSTGSNDGLGALAASGAVSLDDQPTLLHEQFVAIHARSIDRQRLRQIDAALERIHAGDFGVCQECTAVITRRRLEAIPWAPYCVRCQEQLVE